MNNNKSLPTPGSFTSILGVPLKVAQQIYANDTWFTNSDTLPGRFVKIENNNGNLIVKKENTMGAGFHEVTKKKELTASKEVNTNTPQGLINMCFSVWGNKGPYESFKQYYEINGSFPTEDVHIAYLAHLAWAANNNNDYSLSGDKVTQELLEKSRPRLTVENLKDLLKKLKDQNFSKGSPLLLLELRNIYYKAYFNLFNDRESDPLSKLNEGLDLDLANGNLYISSIRGQSGGRRVKKSRKSKKVSRKSKKVSRKSKRVSRK
jgi:hypothetical protein